MLIDPFVVGTIAILEVIAPSDAFSVDTSGCGWPSGQMVRKPSEPTGTTVALKTYACAFDGTPHELSSTLNVSELMGVPGDCRVSRTRQGCVVKSARPPEAGGAK